VTRNRAVFLDRDGVVIHEANYLSDPKKLRLVASAPAAIKRLQKAGYKAVVISNQSGVGRGYFTLATLKKVHAKLHAELKKKGAELDALYYCPHAPERRCACRKPKTLMLERAKKRFKLDVKASWFIGDTTTDLKTARNAGCGALLVRTGKGGKDGAYRVKADKTFKDVGAAASWITRGTV
jgi:histidinol-phosphate phosphatase family protein